MIRLGKLGVVAAARGGEKVGRGECGGKVEWDVKSLGVANLASLKTPGVAGLIQPVYAKGYRLD